MIEIKPKSALEQPIYMLTKPSTCPYLKDHVEKRIATDISELKPYFSKEEYSILSTLMRECTQKLDSIHNYLENNLDARMMK